MLSISEWPNFYSCLRNTSANFISQTLYRFILICIQPKETSIQKQTFGPRCGHCSKKSSQTHKTWTWQPFSSIYTSTLQNYMIKRSEGSDFIIKCYFQWVKARSEESLRRPETRVDHSLDKTDIKGSEEKPISIILFFNWMLKSSLNILYVQKGLNFMVKVVSILIELEVGIIIVGFWIWSTRPDTQ